MEAPTKFSYGNLYLFYSAYCIGKGCSFNPDLVMHKFLLNVDKLALFM